MARYVHWRVRFRTRSERLGVLNLYEENYSGAVVELTPAVVPFETQEDADDNWLVPIRKQTGYIRVLDEGNTEGIMPVGMKDRYVEYTEDGILKWCGYVVPDVYSSDWDVTPVEVEFPVIGGIGVLEGEYMKETDGLGVMSLADIMNQCLSATGISYDRIFMPREVLPSSGSSDYLYPLKLEVSRYNFFSENDTLNSEDADWTRYNGETCYDVLSAILKFWGWTLRERGKDLWITSTANQGSFSIYADGLSAVSYGGAEIIDEDISVGTFYIPSLELAGSDHKKDVLQGRKKVIVKAAVNPVGAVIPSIDKKNMKLLDSFLMDWGSHVEKRKLYVPREGYTNVQLLSYAIATPSAVYDSWQPIAQSTAAISLYVGAYYIEQELVTAEEYEKKKNWNLTETIKINLQDFGGLFPTYEEARNMPILVMRSGGIANYVSGAFVISAQTRSREWEEVAWGDEGNGKGTLELRFRVGDMYWNGSGWVSSPSWFIVEMGNEDNPDDLSGTGKIISTKTLDMPYNGADGYVMPIDQPISGEVELYIHAVRNEGGYAVLLLDNLKVDYFGVDDEEEKSDEAENRYARPTGVSYTEEEEISLKMATNNNNKAGYGVISLEGANIETMYFAGTNQTERPELNLVSKGVQLYSRNTEKLTLNLDTIAANPQDLLTRNGKTYVMASESVNWIEESAQYIIMEI